MCATLIRLCTGIGLLFVTFACLAAIEVHEFDNDIDRQRYQSFIDEMRCPKCQNQNLSGSDSPIAMDLRRELYLMIEEGKSDKEIVDFMVARYGEFILYKPRLSSATLLLWGAPIFLLVFGVALLLLIVRKRRSFEVNGTAELSLEELNRLANLLNASAAKGTASNAGKNNKQESEQ
jgi:cytochrome c-type biogenesis protein CcmH